GRPLRLVPGELRGGRLVSPGLHLDPEADLPAGMPDVEVWDPGGHHRPLGLARAGHIEPEHPECADDPRLDPLLGRAAADAHDGRAGHAAPPATARSSTPCDSRSAAISQYASSISIPIARRPRFFAAINTLPEPANGSNTKSAERVLALTSSALNGIGFGVGCPFGAAIGKPQTGAAQCRLNTAPLWRANTHSSTADNQRCSPFMGDGFVFHQTPVRVVIPSRWKARSQRDNCSWAHQTYTEPRARRAKTGARESMST